MPSRQPDDTDQRTTENRTVPTTTTDSRTTAQATPETHTGITQNQTQDAGRPLDDPVAHAKNNPLKTALLGLGVLAILMNWVELK